MRVYSSILLDRNPLDDVPRHLRLPPVIELGRAPRRDEQRPILILGRDARRIKIRPDMLFQILPYQDFAALPSLLLEPQHVLRPVVLEVAQP